MCVCTFTAHILLYYMICIHKNIIHIFIYVYIRRVPLLPALHCRPVEWHAVVVFIPIVYREKKKRKILPRSSSTAGGWPHVLWSGVVRTSSYRCRMQIIIIIIIVRFTANTRASYYNIILHNIARPAATDHSITIYYLYDIFNIYYIIHWYWSPSFYRGYKCDLTLKKNISPPYPLQCIYIYIAIIIIYADDIQTDSYYILYLTAREQTRTLNRCTLVCVYIRVYYYIWVVNRGGGQQVIDGSPRRRHLVASAHAATGNRWGGVSDRDVAFPVIIFFGAHRTLHTRACAHGIQQ